MVFPKVVFNNLSSPVILYTDSKWLNNAINGELTIAIIKKKIINNLIVLK